MKSMSMRTILYPLAVALLLWCFPRIATAEPQPVRLMSFNIRLGVGQDGENSWPYRRDAVASVIAGDAPLAEGERAARWDIVGLQEVLAFQLLFLEERLPEYGVIGEGRDDGRLRGEGSPILYDRSRWRVALARTFYLSDTPDEPGSASWGNDIPRLCTTAILIDRATGLRLAVLNTHWDHRSQPSRVRSAEAVADAAADLAELADAVVIMGDFNAGEENEAMRRLRERTGTVDSWRVVHPDSDATATFSRWTDDRTEGAKIDAVLVERGAEVLSARIVRERVGGRVPSDHYPVTATVRFTRE